MKYIRVTLKVSDEVTSCMAVNVSKLTMVQSSKASDGGCFIYVVGNKGYLWVEESFEEVLRMIDEA